MTARPADPTLPWSSSYELAWVKIGLLHSEKNAFFARFMCMPTETESALDTHLILSTEMMKMH